ncbi:hypothetical protein LXL04_018509 [Taraxacum kok-saghyz]
MAQFYSTYLSQSFTEAFHTPSIPNFNAKPGVLFQLDNRKMTDEVKLYGAKGSPFACRVKIALNTKGIKYENIEEDIFNKSADLLKYNPVHKKVPVLVHNGNPIAESLVILEYIDDVWKGVPIMPRDSYERALARFWAKFLDDKCIPALKAVGSNGDEKVVAEACEQLQILENELKLKGTKFFGGDDINLIDIAGVFIAFWLGIREEVAGIKFFTEDKFPKLTKWAHDFVNREAVKDALPPREHTLGFYNKMFGKINRMAEDLKLYGAGGSPFVCRVKIVLNMKGIKYENIEEDLANKSADLLKYNPIHKKVPVLVHNGKPICESLVIVEYIDDVWKEVPILPQDPYQRALDRFWAKFIDDKCNAAAFKVFGSNGDEQVVTEACEQLQVLENELKVKGTKFFGGDNINLVDISGTFIAYWLGLFEEATEITFFTKEKFPLLTKWSEDFVKCELVKEFLPPRDNMCIPAIKAVGSNGDEKVVAEACEQLQVLENELKVKGTKFFGGDNINLVDIAAAFIAYWLRIMEEASGITFITQDKFPKITEWADDFVNCQIVKEILPPRENVLAYFKKIFGKV